MRFCTYESMHFAKENPREFQFWNPQNCLLWRERISRANKLTPLFSPGIPAVVSPKPGDLITQKICSVLSDITFRYSNTDSRCTSIQEYKWKVHKNAADVDIRAMLQVVLYSVSPGLGLSNYGSRVTIGLVCFLGGSERGPNNCFINDSA